MKGLKRYLAVIVAVAMMVTAMVPAFAAETSIPADSQICVDLGMIVGDGSGVTPDYLATTPSRIQGAVMFLRLKGLEETAKAYTGTNNFADADKADWAKPIMAYLKDNPALGWVGVGNNTFDPNAELTAQGYYKIMLEALGYKQGTDFEWDDVIGFAKALGMTKASSSVAFSIKDLASATVEALKTPVKGETKTLVATLVEAGKLTAEQAYAAGLMVKPTIAEVINPADIAAKVGDTVTLPETVKVKMSDGSTKDVAVTWGAVDTTTAGTKVVTGTIADTDKTATVNVVVSAVALTFDVSATNLKEIVVAFNKAVDTTTAQTATNYTVTDTTTSTALAVSSATVQADGKTVKLVLTGSVSANQDAVSVVVANVKDTVGQAIASTTKTLTVLDTTIPVAQTVSVVGPKTLRIAFSEPIAVYGTVTLDGGTYYVSVPAVTGASYVDVSTGMILPTGSHTVKVSGFYDYAGFKTVDATLNVDYAVDSTAPTAVVTSANLNKITLTFNKGVKITGINGTDVTAYHTYNNASQTKGTIVPGTVDANGYATVYYVTFINPLPTGSVTLFLNAAANKFEDQWGNDVASAAYVANVVADTTKPTATVSATNDKNILVTFSKAVDPVAAQTKTNYTFMNAAGTVITTAPFDTNGHPVIDIDASQLAAKNQVTIKLATALTGGDYYLQVANIKDTAFIPNTMDTASVQFTVKDTTGPQISSVITNAAKNSILIYFSEPMDAANLTDISNYNYSVDGGTAPVAMPASSTATMIDTQTVKLTLGTAIAGAFGAGNDDRIYVSGNLKDVSGNKIVDSVSLVNALQISSVVSSDAVAAADISSVYVTSTSNVSFVVDKQLSSINASLITIDGVAGSVSGATFVNGVGKSTVTLTIDTTKKAVATDLSGIATNTLSFTAGALTTTFGTTSSTFDIAKAVAQDKIAPALSSMNYTSSNPATVVATYSENINPASVSVYTYAVSGNTVSDVAVGANVVTITLGTALNADSTPVVTQVLGIKDMQGNELAASGAVTSVDKVSPSIVSVAVANKAGGTADTIEAGDVITVTFNEAISASSVNASLTKGGSVSAIDSASTGGVSVAADGIVTVTNIVTFDVGTSITATSFSTNVGLSVDGKVLTITLNAGTSQAITDPADIASITAITTTVKDAASNVLQAGAPVAGTSKRF